VWLIGQIAAKNCDQDCDEYLRRRSDSPPSDFESRRDFTSAARPLRYS